MDVETGVNVRWTVDHFLALDIAIARGLDLELNGKTYKLAPLTFRALGQLMADAKSEALAVYEKTQKTIPPAHRADFRQRAMDINSIVHGRSMDVITLLEQPVTAPKVLRLSLEKNHPDITDEEIDTLLDSNEAASRLMELVIRMTFGPDAVEGGEQKDENPIIGGK